jgi:GT2 family glycosyltransferase
VAALEAQRGVGPFEVVFVDDASADDTPVELGRLQRTSTIPVVVRRQERQQGPSAARNIGWRAARAPRIAFTDDDCRPGPEWLAGLVTNLERADLVQGRTVPDPTQTWRLRPFSRTIVTEKEWGYYETCNVAYRKEALERVGGFDEGFRRPFGEDTDLAWRVKETGGASVFEPDAVVYHAVWPQSFLGHIRDLPRREGMVRVLSRNPKLRYQLPRRWFWEPSHPPALVAAAGLALVATNRSPATTVLGLALLAPYVRHRLKVQRRGSLWRQPVVIPESLIADLVEIGVLAKASARYRTVLL